MLEELAKALRGGVSGRWINIRGPGHRAEDRSLGVILDPSAPDGFRVNPFSPDDDPAECHAYVKSLLQKLAAGGPLTLECNVAEEEAEAQSRIRLAKTIWDEAQPIKGTIAETYLNARGCVLTEQVIAADALRYHPLCRFGRYRFPAMIALMRDVITSEPTGIHRTALRADGLGPKPCALLPS